MQGHAQRQLEGEMTGPEVHLHRIRTHHYRTRLCGRVAVPGEWMPGGISAWAERKNQYEWYKMIMQCDDWLITF